MKALILYFSGTGNTLYVSKRIGEVLNQRNYETEIHSMEENIDISTIEFDLLVLGCPKYYEYPVIHFIKYIEENLPVSKKTIPTMMFCTQSSSAVTNFDYMEKILKGKNYKLVVSKSIPIANNMVIFQSFPLTTPEKRQENLNQFETEIKDLLSCLCTGRESKEKTKPINGVLSHISGSIFTKGFAWFGVKYSTSNACVGCGLCAKKCPVENIDLVSKKPKFSKKCIFCMRCINICPYNAILYNKKPCNQYEPIQMKGN